MLGNKAISNRTTYNLVYSHLNVPRISQTKKDRIAEQVLHYLFSMAPEAIFTNKIAQEIARDEEFTKTILQDLKAKSLIVEVQKNPNGAQYIRRQRWRLSDKTFNIYSRYR